MSSAKKVGRVCMAFCDYEKAVVALYRAVLESPEDIDIRLDLATALSKIKRVEEAKDQWQIIITELDENNSDAYHKLGCYYRDIASDPDKAIAMFEKAVECDPTHAKAHFYLAQLRNDYDEMIAGAQEALRHNAHLENAREWIQETRKAKTEKEAVANMRLLAAF